MPEPSTNVDNPPTQDAPKSGDVIENLVRDYQEKIGPAPSEGDVTSTEPTAPTADTGQPDVGEPQPDLSGKITRLEQDRARQNQLLNALGIDPDSDIADKLATGLITKEELLQQAQTPPQVPTKSPLDNLTKLQNEIQAKINRGEQLTQEDFLRSLQITNELATQNSQLQQQGQFDALVNQCQGATSTVLDADQAHNQAPDDIKSFEKELFWLSTDNTLGRDAQTYGNPPSYYTAQRYSAYAQKNLKEFQKLRNHWIEEGKKMQMQSLNPKPTPNPVSSTTGGGPISPPGASIDVDNIVDMTRQWGQQQSVV